MFLLFPMRTALDAPLCNLGVESLRAGGDTAENANCPNRRRPTSLTPAMRPLTFEDYVTSWKRSYSDIGRFFESSRNDPEFLAIKNRQGMEAFCARRATKLGEEQGVRGAGDGYRKALRCSS